MHSRREVHDWLSTGFDLSDANDAWKGLIAGGTRASSRDASTRARQPSITCKVVLLKTR